MLRTMARDTGVDAFLRQQRGIMSRPDSRPGLSAIGCPVLLIYGRADGISTLEHQQEMLDAIPDGRLEIIEDSGHMLPLERPEKVNALLRAFL
jgi:pimeloyl-ACP methyl ester carboxylesterase